MKLIKIFVMLIPFNWVKIFLYNKLFNYNVDKTCKIGFSYIDVKYLEMKKNSRIASFNLFINCEEICIDEKVDIDKFNKFKEIKLLMNYGSSIGRWNKFMCNIELNCNVGGKLSLGKNSRITVRHFLDLTDDITIGGKCLVAGISSYFWTHGFNLDGNRIQGSIILKDNIYLGSNTRVSFGVKVESNITVGMGSVITKSLDDQGYLYAGIPCKKVKKNSFDNSDYELIGHIEGKEILRKKPELL